MHLLGFSFARKRKARGKGKKISQNKHISKKTPLKLKYLVIKKKSFKKSIMRLMKKNVSKTKPLKEFLKKFIVEDFCADLEQPVMISLRAELDHQFQPLPPDIAADLGQQQQQNENFTGWSRGMSSV